MATLTDTKTDLFQYFATNDDFTMDDYFAQPSVISIDRPLDEAILRAALEEYENQGVITHIPYQEEGGLKKECWILQKPIEQYSQPIELTYPTLSTLTKLINDYCAQTNNKESIVNPLAVTEKDIQSLIVLTHQVLNNAPEEL